ncbi:hypothetical protein ACWD26_36385 [Streptomyces sp. NPDC002787]
MDEPNERRWTRTWTGTWTWAGTSARTRAGAAVVALGAVVVLGGNQAPTTDARTVEAVEAVEAVSAPTRTCHGTQPKGSLAGHATDGVPGDTPLERTVIYVDGLATGRHASIYTGMVLDEDGASLDVYRIPSDPFDTAVCEAAEKGVTVRLHDRDINEEDLTALLDRVSEDMSRWDGTFSMREVGLDGTGVVHVGVDNPETAEPILRKAYGERTARYLRVEYAPQAHLL